MLCCCACLANTLAHRFFAPLYKTSRWFLVLAAFCNTGTRCMWWSSSTATTTATATTTTTRTARRAAAGYAYLGWL